jgi:hypothetical protein
MPLWVREKCSSSRFIDASINADARIGAIVIAGNCTASNIVAGAVNSDVANFGDQNDAVLSGAGVTDSPKALSRIASISVGLTLSGTDSLSNSADHFGFVAQSIGRLTITSLNVTLNPAPHTDNLTLGTTMDIALHEI